MSQAKAIINEIFPVVEAPDLVDANLDLVAIKVNLYLIMFWQDMKSTVN